MGPLKGIGGLPQDPKKIEKSDNKLRVNSEKAYQQGSISGQKITRQDRAEISSTAREMLNIKETAEKYKTAAASAQTLSPEGLEEIKQKVADGYYQSEGITDEIINKLISLPNFAGTTD